MRILIFGSEGRLRNEAHFHNFNYYCFSAYRRLPFWYTGGALDKVRSDSETITVVDNLDNEVTIPKKIDRIVVAGIFPFPSVLSIYFLGSAEKIVGIPPVSMSAAKSGCWGKSFRKFLKQRQDTPMVDDLNIEELMKLNPDVVFYSSGNTEWTKMLKNAGIPGVATFLAQVGL